MTKIAEWCPYCCYEVKLENKFERQICPECDEPILPCSICEDMNCGNCPLEEKGEWYRMTNEEAIKIMEQIKEQFDTSLLYAELGEEYAVEAQEDNKGVVEALNIAINTLKKQKVAKSYLEHFRNREENAVLRTVVESVLEDILVGDTE